MLLPICFKPEKDELFYGWSIELARANGFDNFNSVYSFLYHFMKADLPADVQYGSMCKYDYPSNLDITCRRYEELQSFPTVEEIIRDMTPLYTLFPLLSEHAQVKRSQLLLRSRRGSMLDVSYRTQDIKELRVCPLCMEADRERAGRAYYHVWHQLYGVNTCAVHHVPLMRVTKEKNEYLDEADTLSGLKEMSYNISPEIDKQISEFMYEMYLRPSNMALSGLQNMLLERMKEKGYTAKSPYDDLKNAMIEKGYTFLQDTAWRIRFRETFTSSNLNPMTYLIMLSFLYEDYDEFHKQASVQKILWRERFYREAKRKFEVLSAFGQTMEFRCRVCEESFYMHPYAVLMGFGCPECDRKAGDEQVIHRMISRVGDGNYKLAEKMRAGGKGKETAVLHKTCGETLRLSPYRMIYDGVGYPCEKSVNLNKIRHTVERVSTDFTVIDYRIKNTVTYIEIFHKGCGQSFQVGLRDFTMRPFCRICEPKQYSNERLMQDVKELTGDTYEVVKPFVSQDEKIELQHKLCGTRFECYPSEFLNGRRCSLCTPKFTGDFMKNALNEATNGKSCLIEKPNNSMCIVVQSDGSKVRKSRKIIMQELSCYRSPRFLIDRVKRFEMPISEKGRLYIEIKQACEESGVWDRKMYSSREPELLGNRLTLLKGEGYIEGLGNGIYRLKDRKQPVKASKKNEEE